MQKTNCRACHSSNLHTWLNLGSTPLADDFLSELQLQLPEVYYPLAVNICLACGFNQLTEEVDPQVMYRDEYPYESSITTTGRQHYDAMANWIVDRYQLNPGSQVVDVGSNVGVLLQGFQKLGMKVLGVDPASEIAAQATENGVPTLSVFFGSQEIAAIKGSVSTVDVLTGTNVFAHMADLDDFMKTADSLLSDQGLIVIEAPTLLELLTNLEYDTVYHEHLSYISVKPLVPFFHRHGFEINEVELLPIHGGTIRLVISRSGRYPVQPSVMKMVQREEEQKIYDLSYLSDFARRVAQHRDELFNLVWSLKRKGKNIAAVSAPAKGNTLLNYCGLNSNIIDFVTEKSHRKIGRFTPGTHIPVLSDEQLLESCPDYALILAWNFKDEIMANLSEFHDLGGKFIVPVPTPQIL